MVAACVQADDPLAYGVDKLRHARATTAGDLRGLDAAVPVDRATEHDDARRQLAEALRARQQAEQALGSARAAFDESGRRRWGRKDQQEVATAKAGVDFAEQRLERAAGAEDELRERFASLARHQQQRQQAIAAADAGRKQLKATLAQFDAALDHTRADRVARPGRRPAGPSGRAARASAGLTRRPRRVVPPRPWHRSCPRPQRRLGRAAHGRSPAMARARQDVAIADRLLHSTADLADPAGWAELAGQAAALRNEAQRLVAARAAIDRLLAPAQRVQPSHGMGDTAQQGPELSL